MKRLAWFTPLSPVRSGISQYNRELLPGLSPAYAIDVFVDGAPGRFEPLSGVTLRSAHDFVWRHAQAPYDLVVYQLGNAPCHDYMWPYLVRYPGVSVLHDGALHHARARLLLQHKRVDDYRQEFWFNHPEANPDLAELGAEGLLGSLTYFWPMLGTVVAASSMLVVHNQWLADELRAAHPSAVVHVIDMGVPPSAPQPDARIRVRRRYGIPPDVVLFVAFGKITPEKRIRESLRALAAVAASVRGVHLLLAGEAASHYDAAADAKTFGVDGQVTIAGYLAEAEIDDYLAAADVCLCMRWPSLRETSASWLRCLAAARPTIITDLVHTTDIPALDPRTWSVAQGEAAAVGIDILDEDHSLKLAMKRLATDEKLRQLLGRHAHELWQRRFTLDEMTRAYHRVIDAALAERPHVAPRSRLPRHVLVDGTEHARELLREIGLADLSTDRLWKDAGR